LGAKLELASYERPEIFRTLAEAGPVEEAEMRRTFNLGVGLCVVVEPAQADRAKTLLEDAGETAWVLGEIVDAADAAPDERVEFC